MMQPSAPRDHDHQEVDSPHRFWAKSDACGAPHSLIGHLLDTAAVAELLWARYLSARVRTELDRVSQGRGRDLLVLVAGWHDLGKATPAFQTKVPALMRDLVLRVGSKMGFERWPHAAASAAIAHVALSDAGASGTEWLLPLLAGHHGRIGPNTVPPPLRARRAHGNEDWAAAQQELARKVADQAGVQLAGWALETPSRGMQLAMSGLVIMADWIASSDLFPGLGLGGMDMGQARQRAEAAWGALGLDGGWRPSALLTSMDGFAQRFGWEPRPLQSLAVEMALESPPPGLMIIEAPMGEGKTEAALAASEILAAATGASGVTFAMPTQGTTDAMYVRVKKWLYTVDPMLSPSLLHGKSMLNEAWREELERRTLSDLHGEPDEYGVREELSSPSDGTYAASFTMGRHRGLLEHFAVATVDQLLWAATRTKYVSLRHAGLANHLLIIDEVHSYDVHMGVFLDELLRWCARSGVPVILISATLPPRLKQQLLSAWREGVGLPPAEMSGPGGYPNVLIASADGSVTERTCEVYRDPMSVAVELFDGAVEDFQAIAAALHAEVRDGGCALAIFNTVKRAQSVYSELKATGVPALLIHGRLTAAERARRTQRALEMLGPDGRRPEQFVVIATQIAEQSFDVDADVLFSDVAPMDLLVQRVGRLHRHLANAMQRRERHRSARLVVTGLDMSAGIPHWPSAFADKPDANPPSGTHSPKTVYRPLPLLATASNVRLEPTWLIPTDVPMLVSTAYSEGWSGLEAWQGLAEAAKAHEDAEALARQANAATFRLDVDPTTDARILWNLHVGGSADRDDGRTPVVRDGDESVEVCLLRQDDSGLRTLGGRALGRHGERASRHDIAREVLADSVRLRWLPDLEGLAPLPDWAGHPLLGFSPVLCIDAEGGAMAGKRPIRYDEELGLIEW